MTRTNQESWSRFKRWYLEFSDLGLALDLSRMNFPNDYFDLMQPQIDKALAAMAAVERGDLANPDEKRKVGHYWLRNASLAPDSATGEGIEEVVSEVKSFAHQIHEGQIKGAAGPFKNLLLIGIGGSALGPQLVADALGHPDRDKIKPYFFDNTDPDGIDRVLAQIGPKLGETLCIVISKSGGTRETRNGMLEAEAAYKKAGLPFGRHAVAITKEGSDLDKHATNDKWLRRFPMWDWVGGRTSLCSAVGLLPAALHGFDIDHLLAGARACDDVTRNSDPQRNPALQMALMWHHASKGHGTKDLVIIPYKDRLALLSKYLQQLIMESLGKEKDLGGHVVNQGLTVYGNKGSTDQHAYVQQLRDGVHNFFVTFIEVLKDRDGDDKPIDGNLTTGDYLSGFLLGTREALSQKDRESMTVTIREVSAYSMGVLIALFERSVGFYAPMININPYHQPGVESGKKAAERVIKLQQEMLELLQQRKGERFAAAEIAERMDVEAETIFKICEHLSANPHRGLQKMPGPEPWSARYWVS